MMINHRFQLFAITLGISSLLGTGAAQAQKAGMVAAPHVAAVRARPVSITAVTTARKGNRSSAAAFNRAQSRVASNDFFGGGAFSLFNPIGTTGLGFGDFGLMNLRNQDWAIKAAIDPATQWRLFEAQKYLRVAGLAGSGFYLLDGSGYYEVPSDTGEADQAPEQSQPQQPIMIVQAPQNGQPTEASAPSETEETSAPQPEDVGEFVLVLRNGTQIQAVAFTRASDRIVYITADGLRRTLALADVDTRSTVRINEERGTPVQLPL